MTANTFGSDYDTTLSVYTYIQGRMLTQIACNDDYDSLQSAVFFHASAGVTYYVMVGAYASGPGGQLTFSVGLTCSACTERANRHHIRLARCGSGRLLIAGTATCSGSSSGHVFGEVTQKHAGGAVRGLLQRGRRLW